MIFFNNIDIGVNGTGVACESLTINTEVPIVTSFALGHKRSIARVPNGALKSIVQLSFLPDLQVEPNFGILSSLRTVHQQFNYDAFQLAVGGVSGMGYLSALSFSFATNEKIKASVEYTVFTPLSGTLQNTNQQFTYNQSNYNGVPHANYINFIYLNNYSPVLDLSYSFKANYSPIYALGSKYPIQVQMFDAQESVNLTIDAYRNLMITGNSNLDVTRFQIVGSNPNYGLNFPFDSTSEIKSSSVTLNPNDIARNEYIINTVY